MSKKEDKKKTVVDAEPATTILIADTGGISNVKRIYTSENTPTQEEAIIERNKDRKQLEKIEKKIDVYAKGQEERMEKLEYQTKIISSFTMGFGSSVLTVAMLATLKVIPDIFFEPNKIIVFFIVSILVVFFFRRFSKK